jgi:translation initiation factor IF-2
MVMSGKIMRSSMIRIIREGIVVHSGTLEALKRFKDDVKEVAKGYDCGIQIKGYNDIKQGDVIEAYHEIAVKKKLK